jgi:hypothetical protein
VEMKVRGDAESHILPIDDMVQIVRSKIADLQRTTERAVGG